MRISQLLIPSLLTALISCQKKELPEPEEPEPITTELRTGLPPAPNFINGYFHSTQKLTRYGFNYYSSVSAVALFGDPERDLMSKYDKLTGLWEFSSTSTADNANVSVNRISKNGMSVGGSGTTNYSSTMDIDTAFFDIQPVWTIEGNKTFIPATFRLRLPPKLLNTTYNFSLQVSSGYTLHLSSLVANYDSAGVYIYYNNAFPPIYKSCSYPDSTLELTSRDLGNLKNRTTSYIALIGYNYSHQTVANKLYVFETASRLERMLTIKQ